MRVVHSLRNSATAFWRRAFQVGGSVGVLAQDNSVKIERAYGDVWPSGLELRQRAVHIEGDMTNLCVYGLEVDTTPCWTFNTAAAPSRSVGAVVYINGTTASGMSQFPATMKTEIEDIAVIVPDANGIGSPTLADAYAALYLYQTPLYRPNPDMKWDLRNGNMTALRWEMTSYGSSCQVGQIKTGAIRGGVYLNYVPYFEAAEVTVTGMQQAFDINYSRLVVDKYIGNPSQPLTFNVIKNYPYSQIVIGDSNVPINHVQGYSGDSSAPTRMNYGVIVRGNKDMPGRWFAFFHRSLSK